MRNKSSNIKNYQLLFILIIVALFCYCIKNHTSAFFPFIISFFIAYYLQPVHEFLAIKKKINKKAAILITITPVFLMFFCIIYYLLPIFLLEISNLALKLHINNYFTKVTNLSNLLEPIKNKVPSLFSILQKVIENISNVFITFVNSIIINFVKFSKTVISIATFLLISPILTFYFAIDMQKIKKALYNFVPTSYRQELLILFRDLNKSVLQYLRGQILVCALLSTYYISCFLLLNIDYAIVLGIFAGVFLFIPYFGILLSFVLTLTFAFIQFKSFNIMVYIAITYLFGQIIEGIFITPKIMSKNLNIHPLFIIFGVFLGGSLIGFFGILFAIPLTAVIIVIAKFIIRIYKKSKLYKY